MKIVVDSNIVFSAMLNTNGKLGQLLIDGSKYFDFYSIELLKDEIINHRYKIINILSIDELKFYQIFNFVTNKINFIDDIFLSEDEISIAELLVKDIDENDLLFVALNNFLNSYLWTGDKKLTLGLLHKGYNKIITTDQLFKIYLDETQGKQNNN